MLKFMRKHATGYMIKTMFGLIIIVFIFWGVGSFRAGEKTLAEVGPYNVSVTEYQQTYQRLLNFYRMIYRDQLDEKMMAELSLKEKAMDQLVDKYLILMKADEMNVRVSDKEFTEHLSSMDAFKRDGVFNKAIYVEILKRNGVDPKTFEENEKQSLLVSKTMRIVEDNGIGYSERDALGGYMKERGQVRLGYAVFDPADYRDQVRVDEKEIEGLYEKEKAIHRSEPVYRLHYFVIDEKSPVKDDQAYMELLRTKDLAAYAKSKGLEIVDLGAMKEREVTARLSRLKVDTWLKGMNKGDISLPIRDNTKSYIFQVVDKEEGKPLSKEEAVGAIKVRIAGERAKTLAKAKAEDAIKDKSTKYTKDTGMMPRTSPAIPTLGQIPKEDLDLLQLSPERKLYEKPVEFGGRYYVFSFLEEKQPDQAQWEKEKGAYSQEFAGKKREEFFTAFREEVKKQVKVKINRDLF
jgi:parvulin-like peptidyl-prolyl isomerase